MGYLFRSRVEVWEGSSRLGFRWQLLVLLGSLLYDLFGAAHVVFRGVRVACWSAHVSLLVNALGRVVYPRRSSLKDVRSPDEDLWGLDWQFLDSVGQLVGVEYVGDPPLRRGLP